MFRTKLESNLIGLVHEVSGENDDAVVLLLDQQIPDGATRERIDTTGRLICSHKTMIRTRKMTDTRNQHTQKQNATASNQRNGQTQTTLLATGQSHGFLTQTVFGDELNVRDRLVDHRLDLIIWRTFLLTISLTRQL
jgi:hypothetical protein